VLAFKRRGKRGECSTPTLNTTGEHLHIMSERTQGAVATDDSVMRDVEDPLTARAVLSSFAAGTAGLVAMAPIIAGIPMLLGVFQVDPLARFARLVIADASATLGIAFFAVGGAVVLPLFFVVTASFLPPREPKFVRGVTIAMMFWVSFVFVFWPGDTTVINAAFVVVTLVAHLIYGAVLGGVLDRLTGIPEHDV
jgi:hypothetical protein